jgi:hypothetical protein
MKRGRVLQWAQLVHSVGAIKALGLKTKSPQTIKKMLLASGRAKRVGRGRYRLIDRR